MAGLRQRPEARALLAGGLGSTAGLALGGISATYRYSWFTVLCALVVVGLALGRVTVLAGRDPGAGGDVAPTRAPEAAPTDA